MLGPRLPKVPSWLHCQPLSGALKPPGASEVQPGGKVEGPGQNPLHSAVFSKSLKDSCDEPVTRTLPLSSSRTSTFTVKSSCGVVVTGSSSLKAIANGSVVIGIVLIVGSGCRDAHRSAFAISCA